MELQVLLAVSLQVLEVGEKTPACEGALGAQAVAGMRVLGGASALICRACSCSCSAHAPAGQWHDMHAADITEAPRWASGAWATLRPPHAPRKTLAVQKPQSACTPLLSSRARSLAVEVWADAEHAGGTGSVGWLAPRTWLGSRGSPEGSAWSWRRRAIHSSAHRSSGFAAPGRGRWGSGRGWRARPCTRSGDASSGESRRHRSRRRGRRGTAWQPCACKSVWRLRVVFCHQHLTCSLMWSHLRVARSGERSTCAQHRQESA